MISAQSAQSAASLSSATSSQGLMQQPVASTSTNKRRFLPAWMKWRRTPKAPKSSGRSSLVPTLTSVDTSGSSWNLLHPEDPSSMHSHSPRSSCSSMQDESRSVSENTNLHSDETTSTTMLFSQPVVNSSQLQPPTTSHPNNSKYSFNGQYVPAPATNADIGGSKWVDSFQAKATRKTFFRSSQAFRLPDSPNEK
ncbi:hypothetical protein BDN72DRAFT_833287 [Pluteus cervinus]|uniref:Uncharacterized protein n=1 Tax=Pluteus cervinus TaxID=181527 RepID=A0ACD3B9P6_9AGAR|nr:hypothetical protein BDN72DRAFT_833287 [Pluteus cervinus]